MAPAFCCFCTRSRLDVRQVTVERAAIAVDEYRCHVLLKEKISVSLEMTRGAKIARLQPPLSVKLWRVLLCEACVIGGRAHLDRYNSFTPAPLYIDFSTSLKGPNLPRYSGWCPQRDPFPLDVTRANSSNNLKTLIKQRNLFNTDSCLRKKRPCVSRGTSARSVYYSLLNWFGFRFY